MPCKSRSKVKSAAKVFSLQLKVSFSLCFVVNNLYMFWKIELLHADKATEALITGANLLESRSGDDASE